MFLGVDFVEEVGQFYVFGCYVVFDEFVVEQFVCQCVVFQVLQGIVYGVGQGQFFWYFEFVLDCWVWFQFVFQVVEIGGQVGGDGQVRVGVGVWQVIFDVLCGGFVGWDVQVGGVVVVGLVGVVW